MLPFHASHLHACAARFPVHCPTQASEGIEPAFLRLPERWLLRMRWRISASYAWTRCRGVACPGTSQGDHPSHLK